MFEKNVLKGIPTNLSAGRGHRNELTDNEVLYCLIYHPLPPPQKKKKLFTFTFYLSCPILPW